MVIPHLVHKMAVYTHGDDFYPQFLQNTIFVGDRRYFGRSDKGEITRIKTNQYPFASKIR
jgi:hypothetical protein